MCDSPANRPVAERLRSLPGGAPVAVTVITPWVDSVSDFFTGPSSCLPRHAVKLSGSWAGKAQQADASSPQLGGADA